MRIKIEDIDTKKHLTREEIKKVLGGAYTFIPMDQIVGRFIQPALPQRTPSPHITPTITYGCEHYTQT